MFLKVLVKPKVGNAVMRTHETLRKGEKGGILESQVVVNCPLWILGTELGPSVRTVPKLLAAKPSFQPLLSTFLKMGQTVMLINGITKKTFSQNSPRSFS